jgi:predicted Ser/Thr protein kinase
LVKAETVKYGETDLMQLSPPGGEHRPSSLREDEILPAGTLIGQYKIEALVGRGGMGAVYRAKHTMLQRVVALKILPAKFAKDAEFVQRFRREAQALANLAHPNIVSVHDLGVQGEIYYFAMEYVDGVNMRDILAQKKLSPEDALKVVPQLCEALEYAHSQGIIHRDIKPENILVDKNGRAKIADFGLAKILKGETSMIPLTQTNVVMGTIDYMAPEQRDNLKRVDHRVDIYSLGVVLYEMLTGQLPVGRFAPPSKNLKIDVRIDEVVLKALEQNPDQRYQRASHMGSAVSNVSAGVAKPLWNRTATQGKQIWRGLSHKRKEEVGIYLITNTAFFLFFGLVSGTLIPACIIAIFWGMGLAKAEEHPAAELPVTPSGPRTSAIAFLGFLLSMLAVLVGVALLITHLVEMEWSSSLDQLREMRIGVAATAYAATVLGLLSFFLSAAGSAHVRRSKGSLRGRSWAQTGMLFSLGPIALTLFSIFPHYAKIRERTHQAETAATQFVLHVQRGEMKEAFSLVRTDRTFEVFQVECELYRHSTKMMEPQARSVVIDGRGRGEFYVGSHHQLRFGLEYDRKTLGWRIVYPLERGSYDR